MTRRSFGFSISSLTPSTLPRQDINAINALLLGTRHFIHFISSTTFGSWKKYHAYLLVLDLDSSSCFPVEFIMAGGDEGSSDDVLADLPHDRHAGSLGVSDLERELFEQSLTGSGGGGAGGGHSEPPGGEGSGGTVRFTINDYLAQERSRRTFGTVAKPLHASAGPGSPGNRPAPNASSIVRREREKTILRHLNNMTDRGTYTTGHSRFDLDPQGHLKESVCHQHGDAHGGHAEILPWYAPPIQRQRWNEDHVLPHVDWGDLFYDLFYVGAGEEVMLFTLA